MTTHKLVGTSKPRRRFKVILLIAHPNIDPKKISKVLSLAPHFSSHKGHAIVTPTGQILPSIARISKWNHIFKFNRTTTPIDIAIGNIAASLASHKAFFRKLARESGSAQLYVQLPGDVNNGSAITWELLQQLSDLRMGLGIEVFPKSPDPL